MRLSEIFPEASLRAALGEKVRIKQRDRAQLAEISVLKRACMAEIGGGAWDRYVQKTPACNPQALAEYFDRHDPKIYLAMERHIGQ